VRRAAPPRAPPGGRGGRAPDRITPDILTILKDLDRK